MIFAATFFPSLTNMILANLLMFELLSDKDTILAMPFLERDGVVTQLELFIREIKRGVSRDALIIRPF